MRTLVWFRGKDLRLADHAPLRAAIDAGEVACLFVLDPHFFAPSRAAELPHRMQVLLESIASLADAIERRGSRLFLVEGKSTLVVPELVSEWRVNRVVAHAWTEPFGRARDERVARALRVPLELFEGETLATHGTIRNASGAPFSVFGAFARAFHASVRVDPPLAAPRTIPPPPPGVRAATRALPTLAELGLAKNARLAPGGEAAGGDRLARFLADRAAHYDRDRDRLDLDATSRISIDLKFGTLSPRTVWTAAERALARAHPRAWRSFSSELLWREFAYATLWDHPHLLERPRRTLPRKPVRDEAGWRAWCEGRTGFPVVDAAARQLLAEGFVHNRARMIAASFLTKDLGIDFRGGEAHYLKWLADGDWAQNDFNWQWVAGCGLDAAPFFRVFNPTEQAKKFDPTGAYVRRWVPEMDTPAYPKPILDHREARARYLAGMARPK